MSAPVLTIPQFVAMIAAGRLQMRQVNHSALEQAAAIIETEAKRVIGTYDYKWTELAAMTKAQRKALGFPENEPLLRNGRLRNAIEHWSDHTRAEVGVKDATVGTGTKADPFRNIGDIAVWQLGTSRIPARSFLMGAAVVKEKEIVARIGRQIGMRLFVR